MWSKQSKTWNEREVGPQRNTEEMDKVVLDNIIQYKMEQ